jgi:hypothetical protein
MLIRTYRSIEFIMGGCVGSAYERMVRNNDFFYRKNLLKIIQDFWRGKAFPLVRAQSVSDAPPSAGTPRNAPGEPESASFFEIHRLSSTIWVSDSDTVEQNVLS